MAKGGKSQGSDDWECCEQCSYCFTIFIGILFFLAGLAMATVAGLLLWSDIDLGLDMLEFVEPVALTTFIIGLCIAGTALLGMIMAGCAKCAANPDGVNDCCEKCCTACLSILYIIILSLLIAASLAIAAVLSYFAAQSANVDACPAVSFNELAAPAVETCPVDYAMWELIYETDGENVAWVNAQDVSITCGYYCDGNECLYNATSPQTTGTFCTEGLAGQTKPSFTVYSDTIDFDALVAADAPTTMAMRPTLFNLLDNFLIPMLAVWWAIFVLAVLLVVAACVMCIRKSKTTKESTYKPSQ